jgi:hypothetical protein
MMRAVFVRAGALVVASAVAALASLAPPSPAIRSCAGAGTNHAAIVVQHGNGSVVTRCVAFAGETITGQQLLEQSGISWSGQTFGGFGVAVCALDGEPASYSSCPGATYYWAVFVSRGGAAWQLTAVGVSGLTLRDGDLEGFRYVPTSGAAAPSLPAGVCAAATPAPSHAAPAPSSGGAASPASSPLASATGSGGLPEPSLSPTATATVPRPLPTPAPPIGPAGPDAGLDPGLLAAAVAAGGLAGLAILRVAAMRRRPK